MKNTILGAGTTSVTEILHCVWVVNLPRSVSCWPCCFSLAEHTLTGPQHSLPLPVVGGSLPLCMYRYGQYQHWNTPQFLLSVEIKTKLQIIKEHLEMYDPQSLLYYILEEKPFSVQQLIKKKLSKSQPSFPAQPLSYSEEN